MTNPTNITVVCDSDGCECMYIEGERWESYGEDSVFCCDIVEVADGNPILLEHITIDYYYDEWPKKLSEITTHLKVYDPT